MDSKQIQFGFKMREVDHIGQNHQEYVLE